MSNISQDDIANEARAVKKLCQSSHTNIVQVLEMGQLQADGSLYFIDMELCNFTLEKYISGSNVPQLINWGIISQSFLDFAKEICNIARHIIEGLIFIHGLGEVHRDLSPQNGAHSYNV
jgi:serine/threonine protein kinase